MNRHLIVYLLFIAHIFCSCELDPFINEMDEDYVRFDYYIDKYGNEGIVMKNTSHETFVISLDETSLPWGPMNETVESTTRLIYIYNYITATEILLEMYNLGIEKFPAQAWCNKKNHKENPDASSWRLPTANEIALFYENKSLLNELNKALISVGGVPLDRNSYYWTCEEDFNLLLGHLSLPYNYQLIDYYDQVTYDPYNRAFAVSPLGMCDYQVLENEYVDKSSCSKEIPHKVRAIKYIYVKK